MSGPGCTGPWFTVPYSDWQRVLLQQDGADHSRTQAHSIADVQGIPEALSFGEFAAAGTSDHSWTSRCLQPNNVALGVCANRLDFREHSLKSDWWL
jgi:hypothetical protein